MGVRLLDRLRRTTSVRSETHPETETTPERQRANRVAPALSSKWEQELGIGQTWTPLSYGEYYPRSPACRTTSTALREKRPWPYVMLSESRLCCL